MQNEKHPKSLRIFFATEMWERYGFYVVQSLLALYLALYFKWPDKQVYALVGSFTALTYLSPVVGGWIADKLIGQKRAVLLGAVVLFVSYCLLSLVDDPSVLTASLAAIAVGTGLLKPNISSLLGNEYLSGCARRESGFTIFYMGITTGIILGTTLPSILHDHFGWMASFTSAAIGMIIAFIVFLYGIRKYRIKDYNPFVFQYKKIITAIALMIFLWSLSFYILNSPKLANLIFGLVVLFSAAYILYSVSKENANQSRQTLVIGLLCIISVVFWAFYFQMFMSLTLFISRVVEPTFCGILFPPPYYVTIQSLGMLVIGFVLSRRNLKLNLIERGLSIGKKFLLAIFITTLAYGVIALVSNFTDKNSLLTPLLIIPAYLMFSLAELLLSPVGLAAITLLADKNKVSTMMGIFFVSLGIGGFLSGKLAALTAIPSGETNIAVLKTLYAAAFTQQLGILFLASLCCLVLFAVIKFLLTHVHLTE
ncbi:peptide MFS transporter [Legionella longbeachae]|uniref:Proton-dependent oligopeptide transporter (POT family) n=2 Tax=Legionella longbeachae TaxID=450 RepID=D3HSE7_LEGLN|nr:peptide MFS transporter [Legionella longbeachae]VEE02329.1 Proton-dependent oligopeptide transporter (POT family) [Legionella oakridgensis]HBD7398179.1 peptide MFS transporter [Legionella pneumophila]ARB91385.1 MFS transporter [Legionella longbeachae]EEZ95030.1 amino acid/peptide transporter (Peptide:H+ symporter) family protein [Legionella longbeachae D-4968]QEY51452.1 peptide MFS transporter [Legionella longbeachae]